LGTVDAVRSPYQLQVEDFDYPVADGKLAGSGWTLTDIGSASSPSEVVDAATGYLLLNPGAGDDDGTQIAYNAAPTGTTTAEPQLKLLGPITSTATLMDNREMIMYFRVGFSSETTTWGAKACFGWITTDTSFMAPATGALTIAAGGGTGFHVAEDGTLGVFSTNAAVTSSTDTGVNVLTDIAGVTAGDFVWYTLGFRTRWIDASAGTGSTDFYVNGRKSATITDTMPMDSTEAYSIAFEYLNGAAGFNMDMAVDYVVSGLTRPGLTFPYSTGNY
tara:strand:+ start:8788 stop:9612 length:825 start_codon:yes stop_codon:yes gene_type:complete